MPVNYDHDAEEYARHRGAHPGVVTALVGAADGAVLEVGCGTGNYLAALAAGTTARLSGIDPSESMLRHARPRLPEASVHRGSAEKLPFPDASFGLVYSVDVIHHVADVPAHMAEVSRVLASGGQMCVVTDSEADIRARLPLSRYFPGTVDIELTRYPSVPSLQADMAAAGLTVLPTGHVRRTYALTSAQAYRDRAFSSLHILDEAAVRRGLARLEADLAGGPVEACSLYTLVWARKP